MKSSSIFRKSQLVCAALGAICVAAALPLFAETVEWKGDVGNGEGDAKRPCSRITFKEMPMRYGDTSRFGKKRPYAKDPTVIRHNGRYLMYHSVLAYDRKHFPKDEKRKSKRNAWWGAVASSTNLMDWTRIGDINLVCDPDLFEACFAPCVKKFDGKIHMFHQARGAGGVLKIWHATSEDGVTFTCDGSAPAFSPKGAWSFRGRAIDAEVYRVGDRMMLMYATRDAEGKIQILGQAWAPYSGSYGPGAWTDLSTDGPFFKPELPWEMKCIEAPTVVEHNGIWYMFYAGAYNHERQQIGVAWSKDGVNFRRWSDEPVFPHGKPGSWNAWESGHPGVFKDDDGRVYLFFQGKATLKGDYSLSCVEVVFIEGKQGK